MAPVEISLPPVVGDPAGMRALAAGLRGDAGSTAIVASQLAARIDATEFVGPAAVRIRAQVESSSRRCGRLAERLLALASLLERSASQVEAEQRQRERTLERLRRESVGAGG